MRIESKFLLSNEGTGVPVRVTDGDINDLIKRLNYQGGGAFSDAEKHVSYNGHKVSIPLDTQLNSDEVYGYTLSAGFPGSRHDISLTNCRVPSSGEVKGIECTNLYEITGSFADSHIDAMIGQFDRARQIITEFYMQPVEVGARS